MAKKANKQEKELLVTLRERHKRAVDADQDNRRKALEDMAAADDKGDGAAFMDANYRFRDAWTSLVPNKRLVRAIQLYADHVRYLRAFTLDDPAVRAVVLKGLKRLAAALAAGDGEAAAEAMRAHLENAKQILIDKIRRT